MLSIQVATNPPVLELHDQSASVRKRRGGGDVVKFRSGEVQRRRKAGSISKLNRVAGISWRLASRILVLVAERARQIREVNLINVSMWATADARIGSNAGSWSWRSSYFG